MIGTEKGWYRDPAPADPASPSTMRYWDGIQWTGQVRVASRQERRGWQDEAEAVQRETGTPVARPGAQFTSAAVATTALAVWRTTTPDGQRLAAWWSRVAAFVIDEMITVGVETLLGWRWATQIWQATLAYFEQANHAAHAGTQAQSADALMHAIATPTMLLAGTYWAVKLVYGVGFLKAFQATPGKLVLGIEVRLRAHPGPLSWGTVLLRWLAQNVAGLLHLYPPAAAFSSVYLLVDDLWPLWDGKRQALHDKVAHTNVVRRRW